MTVSFNTDPYSYMQLSNSWGNTDLPFGWAQTASGLYGNIHGLNAINSRYVGDTMPTPWQDPTAPGNTWIYTEMDINNYPFGGGPQQTGVSDGTAGLDQNLFNTFFLMLNDESENNTTNNFNFNVAPNAPTNADPMEQLIAGLITELFA